MHDMRRSAARNLSLSGVKEQLAMKITGHKTNSMYRRYRIVDEDELRQAQERQQAYLQSQMQQERLSRLELDLGNVLTDSKRYSEGVFRVQNGFRAFTRHASG